MSTSRGARSRRLMRWVLVAAGIYNLAWGGFVVLFPTAVFTWSGAEPPRYASIWQCVGMIVGVYGVGYLVAARDPIRHWPITLVGLLGKVFGPIGFLLTASRGELPWSWGATILTNDLIWWVPFGWILYRAGKSYAAERAGSATGGVDFRRAMDSIRSQRGRTLGELNREGRVLVVFLRHSGCTFCREMLAHVQVRRQLIEAGGVQIALVHMSSPLEARQMLAAHGLDDLHHFSDVDCELYQAFGVDRGNAWQVFGPRVLWRGLRLALFGGYGVGWVRGDGLRLPGVFLIEHGEVLAARRASSAADQFDLMAIVEGREPAVHRARPLVNLV